MARDPARRRARRQEIDYSVPSPCVGVCWIDEATGWCEGCFRTSEEIGEWIIMTKPQKLALLDDLAKREAGEVDPKD